MLQRGSLFLGQLFFKREKERSHKSFYKGIHNNTQGLTLFVRENEDPLPFYERVVKNKNKNNSFLFYKAYE